MRLKPVCSFLPIVLGAVLMVGPAVVGSNGPLSYNSAFAEKGSNANGHSQGGNGSSHSQGGNGSSHSQGGSAAGKFTASNDNSATPANGKGKTANSLGALNAAHASAQAFAHASPNSRIGKIKAYYLANKEAVAQKTAFTDALAALPTTNLTPVTLDQFKTIESAYLALQDPTYATLDPTAQAELQAAYTQALTDAGITDAQFVALQPAYTTWQDAEKLATDTLNTAANKTPVNDATRAALDALLVGKIN